MVPDCFFLVTLSKLCIDIVTNHILEIFSASNIGWHKRVLQSIL